MDLRVYFITRCLFHLNVRSVQEGQVLFSLPKLDNERLK